MSNPILVFYGSYRSDRMGIRLAEFVVERLRRRGEAVELIDAKAVNLPMLDRMYKEYPAGEAPERLDRLARKQLQTHAAQQLHPVRVTSSALARPLGQRFLGSNHIRRRRRV